MKNKNSKKMMSRINLVKKFKKSEWDLLMLNFEEMLADNSPISEDYKEIARVIGEKCSLRPDDEHIVEVTGTSTDILIFMARVIQKADGYRGKRVSN